jgi:translation initiation factor IF-1
VRDSDAVGDELIVLDAVLKVVLSNTAFRARLSNGHELVAFAGRNTPPPAGVPGPGARVTLRASPFDLSRGEIVGWADGSLS